MTRYRFQRLYVRTSVMVFTTLLAFLTINVGLGFFYAHIQNHVFPVKPNPETASLPLPVSIVGLNSYDYELISKLYWHMTLDNVVWLFLETYNAKTICGDYGLEYLGPFDGFFLNIDEAGYRWIDPGGPQPWPPNPDDYTIFVFGGSTIFGYKEADNLTIPSYLEYYLRQATGHDNIMVYNWGRGGFASFEEKILFEGLLGDGFVPDMAIFIDGVNDFSRWNGKANAGCQAEQPISQIIQNSLPCDPNEFCLPIQQLGAEAVNWFPEIIDPITDSPIEVQPALDDPVANYTIISNWLHNKQSIETTAANYGVQAVFVMQPHTVYAYDFQYHLFVKSPADAGRWARGHWGYPLWEDLYNDPESEWTDNVINLIRLGEDNQGPLYLDIVHYTNWFMDEIAAALSQALIEGQWLALD